MDVPGILDQLKGYGVTVSVTDNCIRLVPGSRVPSDVVKALREHKSEVLDYLKTQSPTHSSFEGPDRGVYASLPRAQVEIAETINDEFGITDPNYRRYHIIAWTLGYYQDRGETQGNHYDILVRERQRLSRILAENGIG